MAFGAINTITSRRDYFLKCFLFDTNDKETIIEKTATAKNVFYSRYITTEQDALNQISSIYQNIQKIISVETQDQVDIKPNNYVTIGSDLYIVVSANKAPFVKNTQFMQTPNYITTIMLRGV